MPLHEPRSLPPSVCSIDPGNHPLDVDLTSSSSAPCFSGSLLAHRRGLATGDSGKSSLEALKAVRDKTGLSIALCRKALVENGSDVAAALKWLDANEAARAERAKNKLSDRATAAGRIAISASVSRAAIVEVRRA